MFLFWAFFPLRNSVLIFCVQGYNLIFKSYIFHSLCDLQTYFVFVFINGRSNKLFKFRVNSDDIFFQYIESAKIIDNTSRYGRFFSAYLSNAFTSSDLRHYCIFPQLYGFTLFQYCDITFCQSLSICLFISLILSPQVLRF